MAYLVLVEWYPWAGSADFLKERTYLGNQHVSMSLPIVIHRAKNEIIDVITMGAAIWHERLNIDGLAPNSDYRHVTLFLIAL